MRKGILVSLLLLLSPLCFAQQRILNDVEFFTGMPFINGSGINDKDESISFSSENPSFTSGLGFVNYPFPSTDVIGVFFIIGNYYTKAFIYKLPDEKIIFNQGNITAANNYQIGLKLQFLEAGNFKFPFMFGYNLIEITASANPSAGVVWNLNRVSSGIFTSFAAELHFNKSIFLFMRLQATFAFINSSSVLKITEAAKVNNKQAFYVDQRADTEIGLFTTVTPVIGLGLKLNGLFSK